MCAYFLTHCLHCTFSCRSSVTGLWLLSAFDAVRGREAIPPAIPAGCSALNSRYLPSSSWAPAHQGSSQSRGCWGCPFRVLDEQAEPHGAGVVLLCIHSTLCSPVHSFVCPLAEHPWSPFSVPGTGLGTEHWCGMRKAEFLPPQSGCPGGEAANVREQYQPINTRRQ